MKGVKVPQDRWRNWIELPAWDIFLLYVFVTVVLFLVLPRIESRYLSSGGFGLSPNSALAICGAIASGMLALMGIVFSIFFVMIQSSSPAYSPRPVQWFAHDPVVTHSTGVLASTFLYALGTSAWIVRDGGAGVPLLTSMLVFCLLLASVFMFVHLVCRMANLQFTKVLTFIGDQGREVIGETYGPSGEGEGGDGGPAEVPVGAPPWNGIWRGSTPPWGAPTRTRRTAPTPSRRIARGSASPTGPRTDNRGGPLLPWRGLDDLHPMGTVPVRKS